MQLETWLGFLTIAFLAAFIPGPAILLVLSHTLQFGTARALYTIAGNVSGLFTMSACSILGLSALVVYSSFAFSLVKAIGAIYLFYMGIKIWRNGVQLGELTEVKHERFSAKKLYLQGLLISLTNPKAIIFTSALFPQFIVVSKPILPQFILLVTTFMLCSFMCLLSYSLFGRTLKRKLTEKRKLSKKYKQNTEQANSSSTESGVLGKLFGVTFIGAGGALLLSSQK